MTRTETACYGLIASAFILAGLLISQIAMMPNTANAEMVVTRDNFTLMSARTRNGEESLFVINNTTSRLLIYKLDISRKRIELSGGADLNGLFQAGMRDDGEDRDRRGR